MRLMKALVSPNSRGLVATLMGAFLVQILLLAALIQARNQSISEATQIFTAVELFDVADLVMTLDPTQRDALMRVANTPYASVEFHEVLPPREPVSFFERLIGINTRRIDIPLQTGDFMVLQFEDALQETVGFLGQIGLLILFFFLILGLVLLRARAALQPVYRFAYAAKRLSHDLHAPPMELDGSRELIQAAEAMNRMQAALQEQVAGRTRLIAGIGHDLRTFITRLTLRAEFIQNDDQRQKALRDLDEMTQVVNQSLELGAADQMRDPLQILELSEFLTYVTEAFVETGAPVTKGNIPQARVNIRRTALQRAVHNLIENALRYGNKARISGKKKKKQVLIFIDDSGPGIPEDKREEVLKPFVRLESSRNRGTGGTGLGLPLAQSLVVQQGGDLRLDEAPGGGLRAIISLPLAD